MSPQLSNSKESRSKSYRDIDFWRTHRMKIWIIGLFLRFIFTPFEFAERDYEVFIIPVARGMADGGGLYNEVDYNQMPIFPYLNALTLILIGNQNEYITAMFIKFPLVIADFINIIMIYKIGKQLNKERIGLFASLVYALYPLAIYEINRGGWDILANMFVLLAMYYLLEDKPIQVGLSISLGFLTKEFPLYFVGTILVYWRDDKFKVVKSGTTFLITTISIIAIVLIPNETSLNQMFENLTDHPVYTEQGDTCGSACNSPVQYTLEIINSIVNLPSSFLLISWILIFAFINLLAMYLYIKYPSNDSLLSLVLVHSIMMSIFFWSIHYQYIMWSLPWILFHTVNEKTKIIFIPVFLYIAFIFRNTVVYPFGDSFPVAIGHIILSLTVGHLIYDTLINWKTKYQSG